MARHNTTRSLNLPLHEDIASSRVKNGACDCMNCLCIVWVCERCYNLNKTKSKKSRVCVQMCMYDSYANVCICKVSLSSFRFCKNRTSKTKRCRHKCKRRNTNTTAHEHWDIAHTRPTQQYLNTGTEYCMLILQSTAQIPAHLCWSNISWLKVRVVLHSFNGPGSPMFKPTFPVPGS